MKKIDMHVHTRFSGDNTSDPEAIIEKALERGLDGIVFTEHDTYTDEIVFNSLVEKYRDRIMLFRGMELSTELSHTLIYGADLIDVTKRKYSRYSNGGAAIAEVVDLAAERGGIAIPAHPYRWGAGDKLKELPIKSLEGANGNNKPIDNLLAANLAMSMGINIIGGSDSHDPNTVGIVYTVFDDSVTDEVSLITALKESRYQAVVTPLYEELHPEIS